MDQPTSPVNRSPEGAGALFVLGDFVLRSGQRSKWKIECDAITRDEWRALAAMAVGMLPPFRVAIGVPRGGLPFAEALNQYGNPMDWTLPILIAEDVLTTGGSVRRFIDSLVVRNPVFYGVCVFARGLIPDDMPWMLPLFQMPVRPAGAALVAYDAKHLPELT